MYLHVLNGDSTRMTLERTSIPGETLVYADVLHDGPAPANVPPEEFRELRARYLSGEEASADDSVASAFRRKSDEIRDSFRDADDRLARPGDFREVVFWFEHDLFDQLLLIRHLHFLASLPDVSRFRLICIDSFPGHPRFAGLGELNTIELASLFPRRQPITSAQIELGAALWRAFGDEDPRHLSHLVMNGDTTALPFAAGALRRQLEDFPSASDGLARTERQILTAVREGRTAAVDAFVFAARLEERVFMGDTTFWTWMQRLTAGRSPALVLDGAFDDERPPSGTFALTEAGSDVLDGRADYIALNGIDRWSGGVHLVDGRYRWTGSGIELKPLIRP
jgi:hypothetical protein